MRYLNNLKNIYFWAKKKKGLPIPLGNFVNQDLNFQHPETYKNSKLKELLQDSFGKNKLMHFQSMNFIFDYVFFNFIF